MTNKISFIIIFILLLFTFFLPTPYLFLMVALIAVLLFSSEIIAPVYSSFIILILLFIYSPKNDQELILFGFHSPILFFLLAVTGLGIAISKSALGKLFIYYFQSVIHKYSKLPIPLILIIALVPLSLLLPSSITRNAMLLPLLEKFVYTERPWEGKRIYLVLGLINPMASSAFLTGGLSAIVSASLLGGIGWGKWFVLMAMPYYLMMVCSLIYVLIRYPLKNTEAKSLNTLDSEATPPKEKIAFERNDWIMLSTLVMVVLLWVTDKWHHFNPAVPALIGLTILFVFTKSLKWEDIKNSSAWENIIIIGSLLSLVEALKRYGSLDILISFIENNLPKEINEYLIILGCIILTVIFNLFIPNITVCVTFLIPLYIQLSLELGINPFIMGLLTTLTIDCIKLYPTQSTPLLMVYDRNFLNKSDVFQFGITILIVLIFLVMFLILPYWKILVT